MSPEFSYVEYKLAESADKAISEMNNKFINNVRVKVERVKCPYVKDPRNNPDIYIDKIINNKGRTLLIEAAAHNNSRLSLILLNKGASPTFMDWNGLDAISYSLKNSNLELLQNMFEMAASKINTERYVQRLGGTYLIYACRFCP